MIAYVDTGGRTERATGVDVVGWLQVALGALGIVITLLLVQRERQSRALTYAVVNNRSVVVNPSKFALEVRHDGQHVAKPRIVVVRIANSGSQPIAAEDYEEPLTIVLRGAKVLSSDVTVTRPSTLSPSLTRLNVEEVVLERRLLNPRDLIEVQMLVDGVPSAVEVEARVVGVGRITPVKLPQTSWGQPWRFSKVDKAIVIASTLGFIALGASFLWVDSLVSRIVGVAVITFFAVVYPWLSWRSARRNSLFLGV